VDFGRKSSLTLDVNALTTHYTQLTSLVRSVAFEFNKRWIEERQPDCKTPRHRRLTHEMRHELVKCLRTVVLLSLFSTDGQVVSNVLSAMKSMIHMEPEMVVTSVLERAAPALEGLTETRRTNSIIKALDAIAVALVSQEVYPPGAKHLIDLLDMLLPGIDLVGHLRLKYSSLIHGSLERPHKDCMRSCFYSMRC
jgi:proteasome activator subunit 4